MASKRDAEREIGTSPQPKRPEMEDMPTMPPMPGAVAPGGDDMPGWAKVLLHKMDGVDNKMDTMSGQVQEAISVAHAAKDGVRHVETQLTIVQKEMADMKTQWADNQKDIDVKLQNQIEQKMAAIKFSDPKTNDMDDESDILVITGLGDINDEFEAAEWIITELRKHIPTISPDLLKDFYTKGESFNGVLFFRLPKASDVNHIIGMMNKRQVMYQDRTVKFKKDRPLLDRIPTSFLLGLRWQLGEWGFNKSLIKINESNQTLRFDGKLIATIRVDSNALIIDWEDETWKTWTELQDAAEFKNLYNIANEKLKRAADAKKGQGKGNRKHKCDKIKWPCLWAVEQECTD